MNITVLPFASAVMPEFVKDKTVVIIDVLRATSVMVTALSNGAHEIIPSATIVQSRSHKLSHPEALLCGERKGDKIDGFDLGNSPLDYSPETVAGKSVILTTTNGTVAVENSLGAKKLIMGAFLNLDAIVEALNSYREAVLVCAGTENRFSMDDSLCAAWIIHRLNQRVKTVPDDLGNYLLRSLNPKKPLSSALKDCRHANYLVSKGYAGDVDYCLQMDIYDVVPVYDHGRIIAS